jgi:hypothetical protein
MADTRATALLLHNGEGKSFDADQLQQAINEAVGGDVIYLSEGTFLANKGAEDTLVVDKAVSIIGNGSETILSGNLNIAIDGNPTLSGFKIGGMRITRNFFLSKQLRNIEVSKCYIGGYFTATDSVKGIKMDRCYAKSFIPTTYVRSATVMNSVFACVGEDYNNTQSILYNSAGCDLTFMNCSIARIGQWTRLIGHVHDATFVNCIIASIYSWNSENQNNTYINCLCYASPDNSNFTENCYVNNKLSAQGQTSSNNYFPTFKIDGKEITEEMLRENSYFGTDGTIIGAFGGALPYNLDADGLNITESSLKVDPTTRQLNVLLKVSGN